MKIKRLQVAVLFLSFVLFACSGGESSVTPTQNIVSVGNLSVNISGLPDGLSADVTLTGTGVNQKITGSESITGLTTGTYTLTTATVLDANYNYSLDTPAFDISITENQTTEVSLDYLTNEVVSHGVITGFGSVYVNGTHYNTDATQLETDEGDDENINQLKLGMVVSVKGTLSANGVEGIAKSIRHTSKIKGIIDSIDLVTPSITVLSQTILIDEQTIFHDSELDALQATNLVSIDIVDTESGEFLATRIKLYDDDPDAVFKLSGNINELDEATTTFTIYDITVNYGSAEVNGDLVDGTLVSVKSLQQIVDSVFIAESIKVFSDDEHSDNYYTSYRNHAINGFVSDFVSVEEFSLGDFDITTNDETEYKGGIADDIVDGIQLNIHGRINSDGKIVAKKVRFGK
ncbi:MAG: hypothetical protein GY829_00415, partial [Gammaproteobacteria bacterium]|nr:hypothetical protein [Gammaproteobacteria bacterium]